MFSIFSTQHSGEWQYTVYTWHLERPDLFISLMLHMQDQELASFDKLVYTDENSCVSVSAGG